MSSQDDIIKKIKGTNNGPVFSGFAKIDLIYTVEKIVPNDVSLSAELFISDTEVTRFGNMLRAGRWWHLNPTCQIFYHENNEALEYNKQDMKDYLVREIKSYVEELDINSYFLKMTVPISILVCNAQDIDDDIILEADTIIVHSLLGKVILKEVCN